MYKLVEYVAWASTAKFEELLEKIRSDERIYRRQTNHREVSNSESGNFAIPQRSEPSQQELNRPQIMELSIEEEEEYHVVSTTDIHNNGATVPMETNTVRTAVLRRLARGPGYYTSEESTTSDDRSSLYESSDNSNTLDGSFSSSSTLSPEPHEQELHHSQVIQQLAATIEEEELAVHLRPDTMNLHASNDAFPLDTDHSLVLLISAQIKFNDALLYKLSWFRYEGNHRHAIREVSDMIEKRITLLYDPQYKYNLADQQEFCHELLKKLIVLGGKVLLTHGPTFGFPNGNAIFRELVNQLESDALNYSQVILPKFKRMSDLDLSTCIVSDSDSDSAEHILRARKLRLKHLFIEWKANSVVLKLNEETFYCHPPIIDCKYHSFEYATDVNKEHTVRLSKIITQFYQLSQASIRLCSGGYNCGINYQLLAREFGSPPSDHSGKIGTENIIIESPGMTDFLRWFKPRKLTFNCFSDYNAFRDEPLLTSGVDVFEFTGINADQLVENLKAKMVLVRDGATWSDGSILRVLTAHRLSRGNGPPRRIVYVRPINKPDRKDVKKWKQFFESWSRTFEAKHGEIGRKVTFKDQVYSITLILH